MVCRHLAKFVGDRYCSNRDMFLVCHVIKKDHMIKASGEYNNRSLSS